jgi:MinD-like ATPase involved in chromosome partitioning or flagellar assembly
VITLWSVKGGAGVTVVAAGLAVARARRGDGVLVVDLGGDQPAAFGLADAGGPGLVDWLASSSPVASIARLCLDAAPGVRILPCGGPTVTGAGPADPGARVAELVTHLSATGATEVIVDAGPPRHDPLADALAGAGTSLLVIRPCYLALRRARSALRRRPADALVVVEEPDRALRAHDVADILSLPVAASVAADPAVARAVDAGTFGRRIPATLGRSLRRVA